MVMMKICGTVRVSQNCYSAPESKSCDIRGRVFEWGIHDIKWHFNNNNNNNNYYSRDSGLDELFFGFLFSRIWAAESAGSQGIHWKHPISFSVLQSPYNVSIPCCFDTLSLPKMIQMPRHSQLLILTFRAFNPRNLYYWGLKKFK